MPDYTYLTDERAVRAEALDAAALSVNMFVKHMTTTYRHTIPDNVSEGHSSQVDDFLLRAAKWIVTGHDTETDEEGE